MHLLFELYERRYPISQYGLSEADVRHRKAQP